jgi:hypothetical protein
MSRSRGESNEERDEYPEGVAVDDEYSDEEYRELRGVSLASEPTSPVVRPRWLEEDEPGLYEVHDPASPLRGVPWLAEESL